MKASHARLLAHLSFWLATLAMAVMGWTLHVAASNEAASAQRVAAAQDVRQDVAEIKELTTRADSAHNSYLRTGRNSFLAERDQAFGELEQSIKSLRKLTSNNTEQQLRLAQIDKLVVARIASMREDSLQRRTKGISFEQLRAAADAGALASTRIAELGTELRRAEGKMLRQHRVDSADRRSIERAVLVAGVLFGLAVLIPGYLAFVAQSRTRRQTEDRLRVMADSLPGAMYQLRRDGRGMSRFTFMSADFRNVCGIGPRGAALASADWAAMVEAIDERDRAQFVAAMAESLEALSPFRQSYRVTDAAGTSRCLHHEASLQRQAKGVILQNGYIADVTEQRHLEEALQEAKIAADSANRAKSAFLATMSHEIRTPMNGANGMLELLSLTRLDAQQRTTLAIVRESSKSLLRLIDDILDFSMIEAEKLELRPAVVSIKQVIEGVRDIYSGNASSKGLQLKRSTDPHISPAVLVDPLRLRQILNNFVSNALKFTTKGVIEIKADLVERVGLEDRVRFTVTDTGIGISQAAQQRLFQPYSRVDGDHGQGPGGTGLGLAICRRLAGLMGGTVEMASVLGEGTTMTLTLLLAAADPADLPVIDRKKAHDRLSDTTRMRRLPPSAAMAVQEGTLVLVVDDHPTNRTLLSRQVHALGYAAESAENGVEALEKWKSGRYGMVFTDCNMPGMDGFELARAMRSLEPSEGKRTPILACTANALRGEAERCFEAGMDDCLVKPVELAQLLEKLDRWLPLPTSRAAQAAAPPAVDRDLLAEFSDGDAATERRILADFRQSNDADAGVLADAVARCDHLLVASTAHRILGASRMVGAIGIAQACGQIEEAGRQSDWTTVAAGMGAFHREVARLKAHVELL